MSLVKVQGAFLALFPADRNMDQMASFLPTLTARHCVSWVEATTRMHSVLPTAQVKSQLASDNL